MSDAPPSLRLQLAAIPAPVLAAWRSRYAAGDSIELNAFALVDKAAAAMRSRGEQTDAHALWTRMANQCGQMNGPSLELVAATALVGLATGLRPQGFDRLETPGKGRTGDAMATP